MNNERKTTNLSANAVRTILVSKYGFSLEQWWSVLGEMYDMTSYFKDSYQMRLIAGNKPIFVRWTPETQWEIITSNNWYSY